MTRDELEAVLWRGLSTRVNDAEFIDTVLAAADDYALTRYGVTADRRAALNVAAGAVVHWQHPDRSPGTAACHGKRTTAATTRDRDKVNCGSCVQARRWQVAS